ncbi:MAG: glycosyltransferase family 4 protein [Bacteroidia bacterium]|nr:glycosyltransferase family 4 protein [Bacteroidia bacterium]
MHLLYLQQLLTLPETAGNSRSWEFAHQWWETGWDISIISSSAYLKQHPDYPHPKRFPYKWTYKGLDIYVLDIDYSHLMPFSKRLRAFISFYLNAFRVLRDLKKVDAVLAYTAPLSVAELGRKISQRLDAPFFLEVSDVWPDIPIDMGIIKNQSLIKWLHRRTRKIYDHSTHIFPFSSDMKVQIIRKGVEGERITPIPNGVQVVNHKRPSTFSHPKGTVRLLYAGTIGLANDLEQLMQAMAIIENDPTVDIELNVVGEGNDEERVKGKARELGLEKVYFHEKVSKYELKRYWEEADIGIVCFKAIRSLQANGSAKFFDYMAFGLPVVINYEGWQAKILREYNCGMSSKLGDVEALARNLIFLTKNPTIRLRMGGNGKRLIRMQYDRQLLAKQMQELIKEKMPAIQK